MLKSMMLLMSGLLSFAERPLSPAVDHIEKVFSQKRQVLQECLLEHPSRDKSFGCVEAAKYAAAVCQVQHEDDFKYRYRKIPIAYFDRACELSAKADNQMAKFIDLDTKGCVRGYESIPDRLVSLSRNRDLFDEKFAYMYEKNSCKEFRSFVNLCVYVDGDLTEKLPNSYERLPKLEFGKNPEELCQPQTPAGSVGLYMLEYDLKALSASPKNKVYETLIESYRSRMPAAQTRKKPQVFAACEEVRTAYANLGCAKFEKFKDGEPIYYTETEWRQLRIKENSGGSDANAGNNK